MQSAFQIVELHLRSFIQIQIRPKVSWLNLKWSKPEMNVDKLVWL